MPDTATTHRIHPTLIALCEEYGLDVPEPGADWAFEVVDDSFDNDDYQHITRSLVEANCKLRSAGRLDIHPGVDAHGYRFTYRVPNPEWPDPLGYVTSDPPAWVGPQHGWKRAGYFHGNVRGTIPDPGDCVRHPDLQPDAYALNTVSIRPPDLQLGYTLGNPDRPDGSWVVTLSYVQASHSSTNRTCVYSSALGTFPYCADYTGGPGRPERRHIEFFESLDAARTFVNDETGLAIPDRPDDRGVA